MNKPLFLIRGINWTKTSAGVNLIHTLAERLHEKGEVVMMGPCELKPGSPIRVIRNPADVEGYKIVIIEPEVVPDIANFADLVVRWFLNVPGKSGADVTHTWGPDDALFHLCPQFAFKDSKPLSFGMVDHSIFNNDNNPDDRNRTLNCFFARKARFFSGVHFPCPEGYTDLSDTHYTHEELAQIFRKTKKLVTMDLTCCSVEALLCGAHHEFIRSSYLPEPPVEDYLAWHSEMENKSEERLEQFLNYCYQRVGFERKALAAA